ncbi:uncharacterized protein BXZ73DRAFT_80282 [Epithele typhae]|uniref:uncharacterized protein n=1 Tax=Epithele typhae TaxID=378194 RepID=UPI002008B8D6|nr:uncharacterized protein BXZ73DRAFT_80282 [Epithele typhae]KAH9919765.1 hypothetical protein BXZ73DRAFT_80282 [Epithele typhae]
MVSQHRQQLSRIFIPGPPSLNSQQPHPPLFSPALPTAIQTNMHPPFGFPGGPHPLHTPMQANFFAPIPPNAPNRPMHRTRRAGILPPPGVPMTPLGQSFGPQMGLPPFAPPFVPRSKRAASMSVGGPPKAVLGGPQRKVSPLPGTPVVPSTPAPVAVAPPPTKTKKVIVNLPRETVPGDGDAPATRASFAREPVPHAEVPPVVDFKPPETSTIELYPPDSWRLHLPPTVDVFLPGKAAWDGLKQKVIEEKLEKLGVERGSGSSVPHIHAPHARAASISSPADPALLFFKLNKLQQSQNATTVSSLSTSPQPPVNLSPSPNQLPPRLQNRHGHSFSLAPPSSQSPLLNVPSALNPFGPNATLGSDQVFARHSPGLPVGLEMIHAPQGRVPTNVASLAPPLSLSRPDSRESRPDFMRGFGVEIPEEEEPEEEPVQHHHDDDVSEVEDTHADTTMASQDGTEQDGFSTVAQSRVHSRHVSKLSAALSLRRCYAVEDLDADDADIEADGEGDPDQDAVGEWTGSEDLRETSDDESIGEWSNPSDEERARQERSHRRMLRRVKQVKQELEIPRRIPKFPRPPSLPAGVPDDDIVSNPSDEEHGVYGQFYTQETAAGRRPLPPLPHSRSGSTYSAHTGHDPALAHSRSASEQYLTPGGLHPRPPQPPVASNVRSESLNPLAKPFVFGSAPRQSGSWAPGALSGASATPPTVPTPPNHSRMASLAKPLNAAAMEFKPGGFTFRPPAAAPQLSFQPQSAPPAAPRPLPTPPMPVPEPARAIQGREKRQRRSSLDLDDEASEDEDGASTMHSFRFPPPGERHSAPASPPITKDSAVLNVAAKPFTFTGSLPFLHQKKEDVPQSPGLSEDDDENDENRPLMPMPVPQPAMAMPVPQMGAEELPFPPASKPKRAPIPLDFKHPVSTNTVPAGLFKALVNNDDGERTRRTVRSRLSSRDIYEHSPRLSLDDLHVPPISSRGLGRGGRLFTDPGFRDRSPSPEDLFSVRRPRRSSLPPRRNEDEESMSEVSVPPLNLSRRLEMQQYEQRLERLLEDKFDAVRDALDDFKHTAEARGQSIDPSTDAQVKEVISLFRAQLQASAAQGLDNSHMDARGDLDFELLRDIIEQKQEESRVILQRDIADLVLNQSQAHGMSMSRDSDPDLKRLIEEQGDRTVKTLASAMAQLGAHIQSVDVGRASGPGMQDQLFQELYQKLMPHIAALRQEPIDYDVLTARLSQAVKPNISQLIDLASDKRETAGLIVDSLVPMLATLQQPPVDLEAVVGRLTAELRTLVGPLDAHEMKEQVSDLVVERLDSRLAVRDRALNLDALADKLADKVLELANPIAEVQRTVDELAKKEVPVAAPAVVNAEVDVASIKQELVAALSSTLSDLPQRLSTATEAINAAQVQLAAKVAQGSPKDSPNAQMLRNIETLASTVNNDQKHLLAKHDELRTFCQMIVDHVDTLPNCLVDATKVVHDLQADILARDTSQKDAEEIRRLVAANTELQVQLQKARGAHGQVRVEKDLLGDRMKVADADRERLEARVDALQNVAARKTEEMAAVEAKNIELEQALASALERLKAADVQAQSQRERVVVLEKANAEFSEEKMTLKSKVDALELKMSFVEREKDMLSDEVASQKKLNDELSAQSDNWDELRQATDQIQALAALVGQVDQDELHELRRARERSKALESEHAALQRRSKDLENKAATHEKVVQQSRQTLLQSRQRAEEWERRAKEAENELEVTQTKLDEVEQTHSQLDADYSLVKLQLEERDAEERLDKDRQNKLRDQIAALEGQVARLQAEVDKANNTTAAKPNGVVRQPASRYANGHGLSHPPPRPDSRASTIYDEKSRAGTPKAQAHNGTTTDVRAVTPPQPSVRDSIHAPRSYHAQPAALATPVATPKSLYPTHFRKHNFRAPSPSPSVVSAAPTLGEDGWWS